ncbi:hypothetical protein D6833_07545 [Candidatus Parcubacteria bacterium]|nr:MAG: hypothetical protein D6833_07545 [Candidatus Parcubacteria bacterium]
MVLSHARYLNATSQPSVEVERLAYFIDMRLDEFEGLPQFHEPLPTNVSAEVYVFGDAEAGARTYSLFEGFILLIFASICFVVLVVLGRKAAKG